MSLRDRVRDEIIGAADYDFDEGELRDRSFFGFLLSELTVSEVYDAILEAERLIRVARMFVASAEGIIIDDVVEFGPIRLGQEVMVPKREKEKRLTDPDGLLEWLGDIAAVRAAVNITERNVRVTTLRTMSVERGGSEFAPENTFFSVTEATDAPWKLDRLPVAGKNTPQWAQALGEGDRRPVKRTKGTSDAEEG